MHADGYAGFEELYRRGNIKEVACLAHIRRKFFDIHAAHGSGIAKEALERITALYRIEASIRGKPPDERQFASVLTGQPKITATCTAASTGSTQPVTPIAS
jgi:hypothetical protein